VLLLKSDNPTRNKSNPPYGARPGLGTPPLLTIITPSLVATTDAQGEGP